MVYLEFVQEKVNGEVIYDYMPEKRTADRGRISFNRKTGEKKLIKGSRDGDWWPEYLRHAMIRLEEMVESDNLAAETYAAWY